MKKETFNDTELNYYKEIKSELLKLNSYENIRDFIESNLSHIKIEFISVQNNMVNKKRQWQKKKNSDVKISSLDVSKYISYMGFLGGKKSGLKKTFRKEKILLLTYYIVANEETSKESIIKLQRDVFGTANEDQTIINHFSKNGRKPEERITANYDKNRIEMAKKLFNYISI